MGSGNSVKRDINIETKPKLKKILSGNFILGIIDPQIDFFENGSLPVPLASQIVYPINELRDYIFDKGLKTFISMDSHPPNHISFAETHQMKPFTKKNISCSMANNDIIEYEQTLWTTHCVINTPGHKIYPLIKKNPNDIIIKKGIIPNVESYSAFGDMYDNKYENTGLDTLLKESKILDIILVGLAMDYCVYYTALDAIRYGYTVHIILSCVRGIDENVVEDIILGLAKKGVHFYQNISEFRFWNETWTTL